MASDECFEALLFKDNQLWLGKWFGAVRQQAIAWANIDPVLYLRMASGCPLKRKGRLDHRPCSRQVTERMGCNLVIHLPPSILVGVSVSYPTRAVAQLLGESKAYGLDDLMTAPVVIWGRWSKLQCPPATTRAVSQTTIPFLCHNGCIFRTLVSPCRKCLIQVTMSKSSRSLSHKSPTRVFHLPLDEVVTISWSVQPSGQFH